MLIHKGLVPILEKETFSSVISSLANFCHLEADRINTLELGHPAVELFNEIGNKLIDVNTKAYRLNTIGYPHDGKLQYRLDSWDEANSKE